MQTFITVVNFKPVRFDENFARDIAITSSSQQKEEMKEMKSIAQHSLYF